MKKERTPRMKDFNFKYHLIGRIWMIFGILLFFSVPISLGLYYQVMPDWAVFADAGIIVLIIINLFSCIFEPIIYAPMLGTNGEYLAFLTGNLSNLKIPCVVRAHEIYETDRNSEEHEIISTITVAMSSLVTIVIIAIFVLILALAQGAIDGIRNNEWITPAFTCVVYALFGSLGGKYVVRNPKLALLPLAVIVVMSIIFGFTGVNPGSVYLVIGIALCLIFAVIKVVKETKKAKAEAELERLQTIAEGNPELENVEGQEEAKEEVVEETTEDTTENQEEVPQEEQVQETPSEETPSEEENK